MTLICEDLKLENLVLLKKLFKQLLKHQNIEIDITTLLKAFTPPQTQLNAFNATSHKQYREWLNFCDNLWSEVDYQHARDILIFATQLITDFYTDKIHYSGIPINQDTIIDNYDTLYIAKECAKLVKGKYIEDASEHATELKIYQKPIRPWFRDLIIPYKHKIEKYGTSLNKDIMAEKYSNMIKCNRYPTEFAKTLPISIFGTQKTPICKTNKALLSLLNHYDDEVTGKIIFPYLEFTTTLINEYNGSNRQFTQDDLEAHYEKFKFYQKYYNLLHGNSVQTKLTNLKKKYLLIFLNSQIKIQR